MPVSRDHRRIGAASKNALHCSLSSTAGGRMSGDVPPGSRREFDLLMMEGDRSKKIKFFKKTLDKWKRNVIIYLV